MGAWGGVGAKFESFLYCKPNFGLCNWVFETVHRGPCGLLKGAPQDHCVVIDSEKRIILDCYEQYPVALSRENLIKCAGDHAISSRVRVAEVRKVVKRVD